MKSSETKLNKDKKSYSIFTLIAIICGAGVASVDVQYKYNTTKR